MKAHYTPAQSACAPEGEWVVIIEERSLAVVDPFRCATSWGHRLSNTALCTVRSGTPEPPDTLGAIAEDARAEGRLDEMAAIVGEIVDAGIVEAT